jgi:hypothetical protein
MDHGCHCIGFVDSFLVQSVIFYLFSQINKHINVGTGTQNISDGGIDSYDDSNATNSSAIFGRNFLVPNDKDDNEKFTTITGNGSAKGRYTLLGSHQVLNNLCFSFIRSE